MTTCHIFSSIFGEKYSSTEDKSRDRSDRDRGDKYKSSDRHRGDHKDRERERDKGRSRYVQLN